MPTRIARKWHRAWAASFLPRHNNLSLVNKHMKNMGYVGLLVGSMTSNGIDLHKDIDILCVGEELPVIDEGKIDWWLPCEQGFYNTNKAVLPFNLEAEFSALSPGLYIFPNLTRLIYKHRVGRYFLPFPNEQTLAHELGLGVLDISAKLNLLPNRRWRFMSTLEDSKIHHMSDVVFAASQDREIGIAPDVFTVSYDSAEKFDFIFKTVPGMHAFLKQRLAIMPFTRLNGQVFFEDENPAEPIRACDGSVIETHGSAIEFSHWVTLAERVNNGLSLDLGVEHPQFKLYFKKLQIDRTMRNQKPPRHQRTELCAENFVDFETALEVKK